MFALMCPQAHIISVRDIIGKTNIICRRQTSFKKATFVLVDKCGLFVGAGDEARTRYLHLGKVALYQMSYARISKEYYSTFAKIVKG